MLINCQGLFESASSSSASTRWSNLNGVIEQDDNSGSIPVTSTSDDTVAVGVGNVLTLIKKDNNGNDSKSVCDIEFDEGIDALCWSECGVSLIVGDQRGFLHFVTRDGDVIFSHGLLGSKYCEPSRAAVHSTNSVIFCILLTLLCMLPSTPSRKRKWSRICQSQLC